MLFPLKRERLLKLHHPVGPQARYGQHSRTAAGISLRMPSSEGWVSVLCSLVVMSARLPTAGDFLQTVGAGHLVERDSQRQQVFGGTAYAFAG